MSLYEPMEGLTDRLQRHPRDSGDPYRLGPRFRGCN